jgi:hypothetical protein
MAPRRVCFLPGQKPAGGHELTARIPPKQKQGTEVAEGGRVFKARAVPRERAHGARRRENYDTGCTASISKNRPSAQVG